MLLNFFYFKPYPWFMSCSVSSSHIRTWMASPLRIQWKMSSILSLRNRGRAHFPDLVPRIHSFPSENLNEKVCFSWDKTVFQLTDGLRVLHTMMLWLPVQVTHSFRLCPNWMTHSSRRKVGRIHSVTPKNDLYAHTRSIDGADAPGEDWAPIFAPSALTFWSRNATHEL